MLYISGAMQIRGETGFYSACEILSADDLELIAAGSDYCMAKFKNGFTEKGAYKRGHCAAKEFIQSDVLYADIDNEGCTMDTQFSLEDFKRRFSDYEYFISTSKSHMKPKKDDPPLDRYHVFFPLEYSVTDKIVMKGYLQVLHRHFFGMKTIDPSCIDVARKFFGNPNNKSYHNEGKRIHGIIDRLWNDEKNKEQEKEVEKNKQPFISITDPMRRLMIPSLDKAYKLGWFDEYKSWINLGMALKHAGYDVSVWLRYCHTDEDIDLAEKKWDTLNPDGSLNGMKYLYQIHSKLNFISVQSKSSSKY